MEEKEKTIRELIDRDLSIQEIAYRTGVSIEILETYFLKFKNNKNKPKLSNSFIDEKGKYINKFN